MAYKIKKKKEKKVEVFTWKGLVEKVKVDGKPVSFKVKELK